MSLSVLEVDEGGFVVERNPSTKRDFTMINKDGIRYAIIDTPPKETRTDDGKLRKPKKFRAEWMEETHLKDWLQPYPADDTMCVCTACDIVLRCGKSELEKHASGLKHTKRVQDMKAEASHRNENSQTQAHSTVRFEHFLSKNDDQVWIPVTAHAELSMEEDGNEVVEENQDIGFMRPQPKEKSTCDAKLTEALVKLFEFADGKVDLSRKRLEMLQEEHALRLQILEKELRLKTLEVEIKETELKRLRLELIPNGVKESQIQQSTQITLNDHQLHVLSEQHLQEALQAQLQQFQNQFDQHQSQETKGVNVSLSS